MTDNAFPYKSSLTGVYVALGARQKFMKPHCPWQNGKVERLNRTLATEWACRHAFTSNHEPAAALARGKRSTTLNAATAPSAGLPG